MDSTKSGSTRGTSDSDESGNSQKRGEHREVGGESEKASDNPKPVNSKWGHDHTLNSAPVKELLLNLKSGVEGLLEQKKKELAKYKNLKDRLNRG